MSLHTLSVLRTKLYGNDGLLINRIDLLIGSRSRSWCKRYRGILVGAVIENVEGPNLIHTAVSISEIFASPAFQV